MPVSNPNAQTILPPTQSSGGSLKQIANNFRYNTGGNKDAALWSSVGDALSNAQSQIDHIGNALRSPLPQAQVIQITDPSGNLIAEIGNLLGTNNQAYQGLWGKNLYVGGSGPDTAPFFVDSRGSGSQVFVVDQFSNIAAWLGNQTELPKAVVDVTSCVVVPYTGFCQVEVTAHGYVNGDNVNIVGVVGVPNANIGMGIVQVIDADNFVLLQTPFSGAYVSGGECTRFFSGGMFSAMAIGGSQVITNIQNDGGLIQVTVPAHGYSNGYAVIITDTTGIPNLNYISWNITVLDADNFTLNGSVWAGAYDGLGGQCLNWPTAKLVAYDNGDLIITDAEIILNGSGALIVIDPTAGTITVTGTSGPPFSEIEISGLGVFLTQTGAGASSVEVALSSFQGLGLSGPGPAGDTSSVYQTIAGLNFGSGVSILATRNVHQGSNGIAIVGYAESTANGPVFQLTQSRGTQNSPSASASGDLLGGVLAGARVPFSSTSYSGAVKFTATENQSLGHQGTEIQFITTPNGSATPVVVATVGQNGTLIVSNVTISPSNVDSPGFSTGGVPGISSTISYGVSLTVNTGSAVTSVTGVVGLVVTTGAFVTGVTLNLASDTWTEGLLTA